MVSDWLLFIPQVPPDPPSLRVKFWRRLQGLGAVAVKGSVYVLPANERTLEDFQWLAKEIVGAGGEAAVCEARFIGGVDDGAVRALFDAARNAEYDDLIDQAGQLDGTDAAKVRRLRRRFERISEIDHFGASRREAADGAVRALEALEDGSMDTTALSPEAYRGRSWVTREGMKVDRMASAWLIRRFIDPEAAFRFVPAMAPEVKPGELRFDMAEGEFTHEGDRCTFEVLIQRFGLAAPALVPLAEIIHDIDLKDGKYGRPEASGVGLAVLALAASYPPDEDRLAQGSALFEGLYRQFGGE